MIETDWIKVFYNRKDHYSKDPNAKAEQWAFEDIAFEIAKENNISIDAAQRKLVEYIPSLEKYLNSACADKLAIWPKLKKTRNYK